MEDESTADFPCPYCGWEVVYWEKRITYHYVNKIHDFCGTLETDDEILEWGDVEDKDLVCLRCGDLDLERYVKFMKEEKEEEA